MATTISEGTPKRATIAARSRCCSARRRRPRAMRARVTRRAAKSSNDSLNGFWERSSAITSPSYGMSASARATVASEIPRSRANRRKDTIQSSKPSSVVPQCSSVTGVAAGAAGASFAGAFASIRPVARRGHRLPGSARAEERRHEEGCGPHRQRGVGNATCTLRICWSAVAAPVDPEKPYQ